MSNWISVKERLPECDRRPDTFGIQVLVWPRDTLKEGYSEAATAFYGTRYGAASKPVFYMYGRVLSGITHWMPLPDPPEVA